MSATVDFPFFVDRAGDRPMQWQLVEQARRAINEGRLPAGTRLPSTRGLARSLGISRNVVIAAYDELYAEGYTEGRHGSGTYVARDLPDLPVRPMPPRLANPRWLEKDFPPAPLQEAAAAEIDFRLGQPSIQALTSGAWRQIWREMAAIDPPSDYGAAEGQLGLRQAIAAYLGRSRAIACSADLILITSGSLQAVDLVARATLLSGDTVAYEEPGYPISRGTLELNGARIVPVPVDEDGIRIDRLKAIAPPPKLVYVTPSHQYPTGARMPVANRFALLEWARQSNSLIIEDDYDSEFRYNAMPLPALASLDTSGHVVYIGTFSKILTPALRVGYVVAPQSLHDRLVMLKRMTDFHTSWPVQRALTTFIESGRLETHIRQMRRHYGERRTLLGELLRPIAGIARLQGLDAGLHVMLELAAEIEAAKVARLALKRGVHISTLDEYYVGEQDRNALLLGYGGLRADQLNRGCEVLVDEIAGLKAASVR